MEFYMKWKGKAYFRNEFCVKVVQFDEFEQEMSLKYGKKYDFVIRNLINSDGEILFTKDWDWTLL